VCPFPIFFLNILKTEWMKNKGGLIFCAECTPPPLLYMPVAWNMKEPVRCCGTCARSLGPKQEMLEAANQAS
jgi:hypothetical protein